MDLDDLLDEVAGMGNSSNGGKRQGGSAAVPSTNFTYSDHPVKKAPSA